MKEIIEKEIKWCEEHRGMRSEVYEEAFIAGLKQVLFFINEVEKLESDDLLSEGQVIEEWSNWYDKHYEDIELSNKSDVSQMAFWAGVQATKQRSLMLNTFEMDGKRYIILPDDNVELFDNWLVGQNLRLAEERQRLTPREPDKRDSAPSQTLSTPDTLSDLEGLS